MRVQAGRFKGIHVSGKTRYPIRPTTDKTREWIFQFLEPYIIGAHFLDLFAGTGMMGIEAVSRGSQYAVLVDTNTGLLIRNNLRLLGCDQSFRMITDDALKFLRRRHPKKNRFQIIHADPPYDYSEYDSLIRAIASNTILDDNGVFILESGIHSAIATDEIQLATLREKRFGDTRITIFERRNV